MIFIMHFYLFLGIVPNLPFCLLYPSHFFSKKKNSNDFVGLILSDLKNGQHLCFKTVFMTKYTQFRKPIYILYVN